MQGYETETERIHKQLKETLTPREKLVNWWDYHRRYVFMAGFVLLLASYFIVQSLSVPPADYSVAWVGSQELESETADRISDALAQFGTDLNGDGIVHVELHQIPIDLGGIIARGGAQGQKEYGSLMALEADLSAFQSGVFLTDDPVSLQKYTGALLYLDGTEPPEGAEDWENMVLSWENLNLPETGTNWELFLGCRGCWSEKQQETFEQSWILWQNICKNKE